MLYQIPYFKLTLLGWIQSLFQTSKMEDGEGLSKTYDSNYMLIKKNAFQVSKTIESVTRLALLSI